MLIGDAAKRLDDELSELLIPIGRCMDKLIKNNLLLLGFLLSVVGIGWAIGATNLPGDWYAALHKPAFNPPSIVFPLVWTVMYGLIAVAGLRICIRVPASPAMKIWLLQMALNFSWSPVFFSAHAMRAGLAIMAILFVSIVLFIVFAWRVDRVASVLFVPYLVWILFAAILNSALLELN